MGENDKKTIKIKFCDLWFEPVEANLKNWDFYKFLSKRYDIVLSNDPDFLIYESFGYDHLRYQCTRIFCTGENIRPDFKTCDYAFSFDYPVTERNYRLPLYRLYFNDFKLAQKKHLAHRPDSECKRKFCNFIYSNQRAPERIDFLTQLNSYKRVDSGGKVLNNLGYLVDDKLNFQKQYKFSIAFENSSYPGYTTEKILQAFAAETVPIYWGNPIVAKDFNTKSFINCHDFNNFEEVINHVIKVDQDDELYQQYLNAPIFSNGTDNSYINDANIYKQFDKIFSTPIERSRNYLDLIKYGLFIFIAKLKVMLRKVRLRLQVMSN